MCIRDSYQMLHALTSEPLFLVSCQNTRNLWACAAKLGFRELASIASCTIEGGGLNVCRFVCVPKSYWQMPQDFTLTNQITNRGNVSIDIKEVETLLW